MRNVLLASLVAFAALLPASGCVPFGCGGFEGSNDSVYARNDSAEMLIVCGNGGFVANLQTTSIEGLTMGLKVAVIYRPIIAELYELDTEIGPLYYDEVIGPEFRSAARGVCPKRRNSRAASTVISAISWAVGKVSPDHSIFGSSVIFEIHCFPSVSVISPTASSS